MTKREFEQLTLNDLEDIKRLSTLLSYTSTSKLVSTEFKHKYVYLKLFLKSVDIEADDLPIKTLKANINLGSRHIKLMEDLRDNKITRKEFDNENNILVGIARTILK